MAKWYTKKKPCLYDNFKIKVQSNFEKNVLLFNKNMQLILSVFFKVIQIVK